MIMVSTVGMLEHNAKNNPTVIADGETIANYIFTIGSDNKADAPVAGASGAAQTKELYIAMNTGNGDDMNDPTVKIKNGEKISAYRLRDWDGQELIVDEDSIAYANGETFASITSGSTKLVADTTGKLAIAAAVTYYGLYFMAGEKLNINGKNAIRAKIVVA